MDITEYCIDNDLQKGLRLLRLKLREIDDVRVLKLKTEWSNLGTTTYSFEESVRKTKFSAFDILEAIKQLDIKDSDLHNPKWYMVWEDVDEYRIKQALKILSK